MASICKFFDEDAVYKINKKKFIDVGLVLENSEYLSSDDEQSDDPDIKDWGERMKKGHIRVAWHPNGAEEVLPEKKVKLCDRSLMPGDVVRKIIKGKDTQLGYCRYTVVKADVQVVGTKQVLVGIDSRKLHPLEEFVADVAVFKDSWVGMVKTVKTELTVRCNDGSRCLMSDVDAFDLADILDRRGSASEFKKYSFYPGQQLWGPTYCFNKVKWITLNKPLQDMINAPNKNVRVFIEDVKVSALGVQWVCKAYSEDNFKSQATEQPKYHVTGDDLKSVKMMNIFEPCTLQIGDRNYLVMKDQYECISLREWRNRIANRLNADNSPLGKPKARKGSDSKKDTDADECNENSTENSEEKNIENGKEKCNENGKEKCNENGKEKCNENGKEKCYENGKEKCNEDGKQKCNEDGKQKCNENGKESSKEKINSKDDCQNYIKDCSDDEEDESMKSSDASSVTSSTLSSAASIDTAPNIAKKKRGPHYATKMKKEKKKSVRRRAMRQVMKEALPLRHDAKLVTETLVTETKAHVVWQDGTVETDILSTSLYPVHHLDSHEFFPGDYVVESKESRPYEYGVIKKVDHSGRTALVAWMKTYHAGASPHPEVLNEQEVSVYDIKDHPDFKYRPGACVIRVVNAEDSNPGSTAGQVVDVHPTGQVEVSWVNGDTSLCYPQELYRVGEYDSDDLWADDESISDEDSWETESEKSLVGLEDVITEKDIDGATRDLEKISIKFDDKDDEKSTEDMQEKLLANIEKLRAGMARLEEVFTQNPTLQTCNVMRRLLELYKHCKVLDQLLGTTYFHERHLQSLVERLKHRGRVNSIQHMADQIFRLFSSNDANSDANDSREDVSEAEKTLLNDTSKVDIDILIDSSKAEDPTEVEQSNLNDSSKVDIDIFIESPTKESPPLLTNHCNEEGTNRKPLLSPVSPTSSEPRNLCQQLCAILKSRLLKAHEDAEQRFGMPRSETSALLAAEVDQVAPAEENEAELEIPPNDKNTQTNNEQNKVPEEKPPPIVLDEEGPELITAGQGVFSMLESVPDSHKYKLSIFQPVEASAFFRVVKKEMKLLKSSLPEGIIVKSFEDRIDLYSVLIKGPRRTPYEDGLFFFDFQLPADYPKGPPLCHYISYCSDRLNPNLYEGGKVCVSLLGTWGGKGTEMWDPLSSNLLQVIVSIQGLILVSEPYYNEAGYERQKGTQLGMENSRMYNEMVVLKLVQSMTKLIFSPPDVFRTEIIEHFQSQSSKFIQRLERWLEISESYNAEHPLSPTSPTTFKEIHSKNYDSNAQDVPLPEFPLIPASKGFCLTLRKSLSQFKNILASSLPPPTVC